MTRLNMLLAAALPVEAIGAEIDERAAEAAFRAEGGTIQRLAARLAAAKALAVSRLHPEALVFGADQTLTLGDEALHKAPTRAAAAQALRRLAGRRHRLTSAIAIAAAGRVLFEIEDIADMTMRAFDEGAIARYLDVAGDAALQSVGAYQWEGVGMHLFSRAVGQQSTILGLPLMPLAAWLRDHEWIGP